MTVELSADLRVAVEELRELYCSGVRHVTYVLNGYRLYLPDSRHGVRFLRLMDELVEVAL